MKRVLLVLLLCLSILPAAVLGTAAPAAAQPPGVPRQSAVLNPRFGWDIADNTALGYSKSPAIIDAINGFYRWTCDWSLAPYPPAPETIWFSTSTDGVTWKPGKVALSPGASGQLDSYGVCDPSVVEIAGYFYLAYTGTDTAGRHGIFVARSQAPDGPYAKWTGTGWGDTDRALPIIPTTPHGYGTGGPSLVVEDSTLSVYYDFHVGSNWQTRVRTVDVSSNSATWPTRLQDQGTAFEHPGSDPSPCNNTGSTDSTDVKYVDALNRFVAVTSDSQNYAQSAIQTWESQDGIHFTRAVTMRGDFHDNTINVSLAGDVTGHLTPATPPLIAYSYGGDSTCHPAALRISQIELYAAATGFYADPLEKDKGQWRVGQGDWSYPRSSGDFPGYAQHSLTSGNFSTLASYRVGDSWSLDVDIEQFVWPFSDYGGINFGQQKIDDSYQSGYRALFWQTGLVQLWKDGQLVASNLLSPPHEKGHLQVVQSGPNIKIYVGQSGYIGHLADPAIEYIDQQTPYLGGFVSLAAGGETWFTNLRITDNVPAAYKGTDWVPNTGSWTLPAANRLVQSSAAGGQVFLQTGPTNTTGPFKAHLGDGTYTATIKLDPGSDQTAWGGVNITNTSPNPTLSWGDGGYLVFLRRNGNLGLWKAGTGQVVGDQQTGTQPTVTPVSLRIVKFGSSLKVYVNGSQMPTINFRDLTSTLPKIGGFGVATLSTGGSFTDVEYAANNGA